MNWKGIEIVCPDCRGELERTVEEHEDSPGEVLCHKCSRRFPVVSGIPDLRVFPDPYITPDEEYAKVRHLASRYDDCDFAGLVEYYYSISPLVPSHHAKKYARGLLAAAARTQLWLEGWEKAAAAHGLPAGGTDTHHVTPHWFLDLGCGTGPLLAAARSYPQRAGLDIALRWLVVGKKRLTEAGLDLPLICACTEALPFRDAQFATVAADSVVEHLRDQPLALREVHRVTHPGGRLFLATPNRFSLGPDPQTGLWAGSLLPLSWTQALVSRQGGLPPRRHLLSKWALRRLIREAGFANPFIFLPGVPAEQAHFPAAVRAAMSLYDVARRLPLSRQLLHLIGPMLHAVTWKPQP